MSRFYFGWQTKERTKGIIYFDGVFFANVYQNHADYGSGWVLNRDALAFQMGLEPQAAFETIGDMQKFLDNWLEIMHPKA